MQRGRMGRARGAAGVHGEAGGVRAAVRGDGARLCRACAVHRQRGGGPQPPVQGGAGRGRHWCADGAPRSPRRLRLRLTPPRKAGAAFLVPNAPAAEAAPPLAYTTAKGEVERLAGLSLFGEVEWEQLDDLCAGGACSAAATAAALGPKGVQSVARWRALAAVKCAPTLAEVERTFAAAQPHLEGAEFLRALFERARADRGAELRARCEEGEGRSVRD